MKWTKPVYKAGVTRIVSRFAWFPIEINGETRWLETVKISQILRADHMSIPSHWRDVSFVD